ncbi:DNA ligase [Madurella mycetomatis]|uniref:DNA ligase n=1 Tax=Madurella mycetomatis TaxID=100816 RepID=A0A175W142_9PEZI|nr:DNA ligase [Madurella mycetomatis]
MPPEDEIRAWTCQVDDLTYTCSTDPRLIQLDAVNAAFSSDMVYWAKPLAPKALKRCIEMSLCFGLYVQEGGEQAKVEDAASLPGPTSNQKMIGLSRLITDYVTFGYLTDVYILGAHQGKGLGRWMMGCVDEVLASWPSLRRCMLFTRDASAVRLYAETLGMTDVRETPSASLFLLERHAALVQGRAYKARQRGEAEGLEDGR